MTDDRSSAKPEPAALLWVAVEAAREAGEMLRAEFHRSGGPRVSGATAAIDAEVETALKTRLRAALS